MPENFLADGSAARHTPHVQSYIVATDRVDLPPMVFKDALALINKEEGTLLQPKRARQSLYNCMQVGLQVLLDAGHVFKCHPTLKHVIYHSEMGSAEAIFKAGYTIDSLMLRYQGVNWSDSTNWDCNAKYVATRTRTAHSPCFADV